MSEINSIANGTFTIGQTSATNFQAGPGISITQPSEGTVRISNDETVLFENAAGTSANISLSEPLSGFTTCKIYAFPNELTVTASFVEEWPADTSRFGMAHWVYHGGNANYPYVIYCTRYDLNGNAFSFDRANHTWFDTNFTKAGASNSSPLMITKIVGINRKEV